MNISSKIDSKISNVELALDLIDFKLKVIESTKGNTKSAFLQPLYNEFNYKYNIISKVNAIAYGISNDIRKEWNKESNPQKPFDIVVNKVKVKVKKRKWFIKEDLFLFSVYGIDYYLFIEKNKYCNIQFFQKNLPLLNVNIPNIAFFNDRSCSYIYENKDKPTIYFNIFNPGEWILPICNLGIDIQNEMLRRWNR